MFNFLNTTVLLAAAAALIPLLIHLFSKRKVKVVEFSSLRHLKSMQRRQVKKLKIKQLLLLLLRMLIILVAVLAFARPTTESGNLGSHAGVSAVIVFDNSRSMDRYVADGNLFDIAKAKTNELLNIFGEADEVVLLPLDDKLETTGDFMSSGAVREQLETIKLSNTPRTLTAALEKAVEQLKSARSLNKELYLISDRQTISLPDSLILKNIEANFYQLELPLEAVDNCGVLSVDFGGQLILPGHDFNLITKIKNYSDENKEAQIASLYLDGNRVAQTDYAIPAGEAIELRFNRSVAGNGFHSGYIEISDDKFPGDNKYYFSFNIPERSSLLIIDGDHTGPLINTALLPSTDINQYWSVKIATPEQLRGIQLWEYDVILLAGSPKLLEGYTRRFKSFLASGKTLIFTYGDNTDREYFNDTYSEFTGLTLNEKYNPNFNRAGFYSIKNLDIEHPIFSVFNFQQNDLPQIKFFTLPKFQTEPFVKTIMSFTGGRPALVENRYEGGMVLTFCGMISPLYSELSTKAFFVPFISRLVEYGASDLTAYELNLYSGRNISRPLPDNYSINQSLELVAPDSSRYDISPDNQTEDKNITISYTDQSGIYSILSDNKEIDRFALNLDPTEADLATTDNDQFQKALGADEMKKLDDKVQYAQLIAEFRHGKELWQLFLWLAVLLVAFEIWLSRSGKNEVE